MSADSTATEHSGSREPRGVAVSILLKFLLLLAGIVQMLAALGVIPVEPGKIHGSGALFFIGLILAVIGLLTLLQPLGARFPASLRFVEALMLTAFFGLGAAVTYYSHDEELFIGPLVFSGQWVDVSSKIMLVLFAVIIGAIAAWCWARWWRALHA